MIPVIWAKAALADLQHIRRYIADFNPYAAHDMAERILEAGNGLASFPFRGRAVPSTQIRETTIAYPYIIRYRIERERVVILRVRHGARRRSR
ncbi:MAG: type II toxin-antitoxin system RelE/ParE family toxin [Rhodomicrobium sp.]